MFKFSILDNILIRTPLLLSSHSLNIRDESFLKECIYKDNVVLESIRQSSESLYQRLDKNLKSATSLPLPPISAVKYYLRMSTRPTPFGRMAAYSLVKFADNEEDTGACDSNVQLESIVETFARPKAETFYDTVEAISSTMEYKMAANYLKNNTVYIVNEDTIYYCEYNKKEKRYLLSQIVASEILIFILKLTEKPHTLSDLCMKTSREFSNLKYGEIFNFLLTLIENQILISTYELYLFTPINVKRFMDFCRNNLSNESFQFLTEPYQSLLYKEMADHEKNKSNFYNSKTLFSEDLKRTSKTQQVSLKLKSALKESLNVYFSVAVQTDDSSEKIKTFSNLFEKRYGEDRKINLLEALNPFIGIGYPNANTLIEEMTLIDGIELPSVNEEEIDESNLIKKYTLLELLIYYRILSSNSPLCELTEKEILDLKSSHQGQKIIQKTLYAITEVFLDENEEYIIYIKGCGGTSAIVPFLRYSLVDSEINSLIHTLIDKDKRDDDEFEISADIIFKTNTNLDNILTHLFFEEFSIMGVKCTDDDDNFIINLSDLQLELSNDKIKLYSKKLKKYINPINRTVHNYTKSSDVFYNFLSSLSDVNSSNFGIPISYLFRNLSFIPRIQYKRTILMPACWAIYSQDIDELEGIFKSKDFFSELKIWREERKLPDRVIFNDGDQGLLLDLTCKCGIELLFDVYRKTKKFWVFENLYDSFRSATTNTSEAQFNNEFIFTLSSE